jgi:hypothetical protein
MTSPAVRSCANRTERGYALLFVLFLMALVLIGASTAVLSTLTEGRREREAQMIWRGKQYQRAIGRYYRKFGRFPTSIDDLVKVQDGEIRFLREAYKNPMNTEDGSWRFIYVTPSGQLIGSVQYTSLQQMAFLDQERKIGLAGAQAAAAAGTGPDADNPDNGPGSDAGAQGGNNSALSNIPLGGISSGGAVNPSNLSPSQLQALQSQLQALAEQYQGQIPPQLQGQLQQLLQQVQGQNSQQGSSSVFPQSQPGGQAPSTNGGLAVNESSDSSASTDAEGEVIGGFIVGVAGKENKPSIKIYNGGKTYKRWEFIFNPLEQVQTIGVSGVAASPTGSQPIGQTVAPNPFQQPQIPQQQPQNPQQQPQQQ